MQAMACYAVDKFDVLPDLPDSLVQTAEGVGGGSWSISFLQK